MIVIAALLIVASVAMALVAASPLVRTLSVAIDSWADGVHGRDAELLP